MQIKQNISKQEKNLPANRGRTLEDIPTTGCKGKNNFGAKYENEENITEKSNR